MADTDEVEACTTSEIFQNKLEEAFNELKENATDQEMVEAKDATIKLCYRFVEDDDDDDEEEEEKEDEQEDEEASSEEVLEADRKKHDEAAKQITLLLGKQRFLLCRELCACMRRIKEHNQRIVHLKSEDANLIMSNREAEELIKFNEAQRQKQNEVVVSLRDRFCVYQQQIVDQDAELLDSLRADVPKDCRDATPCDCLSGNTVCLTDVEKAFEIVETIESWTKYYKEDYVEDDEDVDDGPPPPKKAKVTTGIQREFQVGNPVMVKYPDKWHHGVVTHYFSTTQAKGNRKIKAGYVVDFIDETTWLDGLQPKKGKKMRSPDEEEEELFADVDAAAIVEEAEDRFT